MSTVSHSNIDSNFSHGTNIFFSLAAKGDATTSTIVQESTIFTINVQLSTIIVKIKKTVTIIVDNCTLIVKMVDSCTIVLVVASPLLAAPFVATSPLNKG
jgi:hypothetical protein